MEAASPVRVTYRSVLRIREFQALFLSQGLSLMGDQVARIAIALLVFDRTGSAFAASATYACSYLTWLLGAPFLSALSDRYPRRTVMVLCDLLRAALTLLLIIPDIPLACVFAILVLVALLAPPFDSARSAVLPDVLPEHAYPTGNAVMNMLFQVGQALGFLLGGLLVAAFGTRSALLLDAATFLLSGLLVLLFLRPHRPVEARETNLLREALDGVSAIRHDPLLRRLLAWGMLGAGAVIAPEGLAVAVAAGRGDGAAVAGLLTASVSLGFVLGSFLVLRLVPVERRLDSLPWLGALCCGPLLLTPLASTSWIIALLWTAAGAGSVLQLVASTAYIAASPRELRGRAYGVAVSGLMSVQGVVLLVAGAAAELLDPRAVVAAIALLSLGGVWALGRLPRVHDHRLVPVAKGTASGGRGTAR